MRLPLPKLELAAAVVMLVGIGLGVYAGDASTFAIHDAGARLQSEIADIGSMDELLKAMHQAATGVAVSNRYRRYEGYGRWLFFFGLGSFVVLGRFHQQAVPAVPQEKDASV